MKHFDHPEHYDSFIDAVKINLIRWRKKSEPDFPEIAEKLGISERTARRRYRSPETLTLQEFYLWCELYKKDPYKILESALHSSVPGPISEEE